MALLTIITVPDPRLTERAREVRPDEFGPALQALTADMAETMYAAPGVGLAAPQVADLRRILVADPGEEDEEGAVKRGRNYLAMVNPVVVWRSEEREVSEEGCLSVPDFWEDVERPQRVRVRWQDPLGEVHEADFEGFPAVVVQHEMDHLEGVLILDHVSRFKRSRYLHARRKAERKQQTG